MTTSGNGTAAMIRLQNIHKTYRMGTVEVHALRGIDLEIARGEYIAIMGPSGSGKSTLMNLLGCLDRPSSGIYELNGRHVEDLDDEELSLVRNREIGFVFQSFNLLPQLNILHNVELPLVYANVHARERHTRSTAVIERVGLTDRAHHRPNELSGGQRQRVAIARALVNKPSLLLADEPTGNLDSKTGTEIMGLIRELHSHGNTVLLVTHDRETARDAGRVVHIRDGVVGEIEVVGGKPA